MADRPEGDDKKRDEVLKRMLNTPPERRSQKKQPKTEPPESIRVSQEEIVKNSLATKK